MSRLTNIEDLLCFEAPSYPRLSPNGKWVAYLVKTIDEKKNRYDTQLWIATTEDESKGPRQITHGESVSQFYWAPNSQHLYFVRNDSEKKPQLWELELGWGEAWQLTRQSNEKGMLDSIAIPSREMILYSLKPTNEAWTEKAIETRKNENQSSPPRMINRLRWRSEGIGWLPQGNYTLVSSGGSITRGLLSDREFGNLCISPGGHLNAYTQNVADDPDRKAGATAIFTEDSLGGDHKQVEHLGPVAGLCWSPDGKYLAFLGHDDPDEVWGTKNAHVWVVDVETGISRDLTPGWDVTAGDLALGEVYGRGDTGPVWESETSLLFVASDRGEVGVYRIGLGGGVPEKITPEGCSEVGVSVAAGKIATLRMTGKDEGAVFVDGKRVSWNLGGFYEKLLFIEPKAFSVGEVPCFALIPEGDGPFPTILYIHGGPHLMYGRWHLFHEYQALAAAGFAVLYPNPRGSKGYGEAWTGAIRDNWGAPAMDDCMACVDYAIAQGWSDPSRLAVMGGSYGGYLTAWIVGHTDRFACAIAERGVYNLQSFGGTTDFVQTDHSYFLSNHTDDTESFRRNSPITYAGNVKTPLLVVHSEGDLRCPVSQGDEYYRAVKRTSSAEVSYLRFGPEASHELSRGGPPDLRIERQKRFHEWLRKHLISDVLCT